MRTLTRVVAAMQLALILPAALFLTSVLVAAGDPPQYELAHVAQRIVTWYAGRGWTLFLLLLALPLAVLVTGCVTLLRGRKGDVATLLVAGTTMASAAILAVVVLHMAAN